MYETPFPSSVEPEISPERDLYQFVVGEENVAISFISSGREYPALNSSRVTMFFQDMTGTVSEVTSDDMRQLSNDNLTLTFLSINPEVNGTYWVVAENLAGSTTSPETTVEVFSEYSN